MFEPKITTKIYQENNMTELLTIKEASQWATGHLNKNVTPSNISYLIQYGKVKKYEATGNIFVDKNDLIVYYQNIHQQRETNWKEKLGQDLNWDLSFANLREKDTTKHIHRLHPYKGKFIPQLVEYFLDEHTDNFKKQIYFHTGDIILDPFCGSGTTMVQANELGIHAIGIDISAFNALIANAKITKINSEDLRAELHNITFSLKEFIAINNNIPFESELQEELAIFNKKYFPSPEYKIKIKQKEINEKEYAAQKEMEFAPNFYRLQKKYNLKIEQDHANNFHDNNFLGKWYLEPIKKEIDFIFEQLKKIKNTTLKEIITIILSRTIRSCRATTHADLATLKEPVTQTYYCKKHGKICKPLFSILSWWERYSKDTIQRLYEFDSLRTHTFQNCLQGDARNLDIVSQLEKTNPDFASLVKNQKIRGIFSSPPYVGLINYHEQHAYAYDLFGFERNDDLELGPLYKGQGKEARDLYMAGIANVLNNSKRFLQKDYDIFLVANDKYNMYPTIAEKAEMKIINQYKRPVLNRTEKDRAAYSEIIFHFKER